MNKENLQTGRQTHQLVFNIWENIELYICLIAMIGMTVLTFVQVIARFVFHSPFGWGEEICRFFIIWVTFGGSAYAFRLGAHIGIDFFVNLFPPGGRYVMKIVYYVGTIIFFIIVGYYGYEHTYQQYLNSQVTPVLRMPIAFPYSAIPIGSGLIILRLFYMLIQDMKKGIEGGTN